MDLEQKIQLHTLAIVFGMVFDILLINN